MVATDIADSEFRLLAWCLRDGGLDPQVFEMAYGQLYTAAYRTLIRRGLIEQIGYGSRLTREGRRTAQHHRRWKSFRKHHMIYIEGAATYDL